LEVETGEQAPPSDGACREVKMLGDTNAIANVAVKDLEVARQFYVGKLGLNEQKSEEAEVLACKSGDSLIFVYKSEYAGTNKATSVTWEVKDVPGEVKALKNKGITFEHYEFPGGRLEGDVHILGDMKAAWFKDPDGNILALVGH
jgi:catechol 2,3-dioxygenase-like lactoylglutathione lyase family enzyme